MNSHEALNYAYQKGYYVKDEKVFSSYGEIKPVLHNYNGFYYYRFNVSIGLKKTTSIMVHRLVAYQKYGDQIFQEGIVVRHKNGNSKDNRESNILIGTQSDNRMDIPKDIRCRVSSEAGRRFSDVEALSIISDRDNGMTYKELGNRYNVSKSTLSYFFNDSQYVKKLV